MSNTKDSFDWKTASWILLSLLLVSWVALAVLVKRLSRCGRSTSQTGDCSFPLVAGHNNEGHCAENENCTAGNDLDDIEEGVIPDRDGPEEL